MAFEIAKLLQGKKTWLQRFSFGKEKRPDHELETRARERDVLEQAHSDYEAAAQRERSAA